MKKAIKILLKALTAVILALVLIVAGYLSYVVLSYYRLPDKIQVKTQRGKTEYSEMKRDKTYGITTYNVGFGAYTQDFSFFMDGGEKSHAESLESATDCINGVAQVVRALSPDLMLWQEVDKKGTRSHHLNENKLLRSNYPEYDSVFTQNYSSPFLFYPFHEPHGRNRSGIVTMSAFPVKSTIRRSLPISDSFSKILDLDRCYSISKIPVEGGKYLSLFNVHLSAYGSSDEVRKGQAEMLTKDLEEEYKAGNYVICGGDFNHDLKELSTDVGQRESWAYPFPRNYLPDGFEFCIDAFSEKEKAEMHNSCRNANEPYNPDTTYTVTVDGFIISPNVKMKSYENIDTQYLYSDHDPVYMKFKLK